MCVSFEELLYFCDIFLCKEFAEEINKKHKQSLSSEKARERKSDREKERSEREENDS